MNCRICILAALMVTVTAMGQEKHDIAISTNLGYETIYHKNKDFNPAGSDHGYTYDVNVEYFTTPSVALNGGIYMEHQGVFTGLSDGIGLSTNNLMGVHFGLKYYPLAGKGIVQPYIAGTVYLNFLGLQRKGGTEDIYSNVYECNGQYHFVRQNAGGSISPQIGIDIRLTDRISLTASYDYRLALYGYNHTTYTFYGGKYFGKVADHQKNVNRSVISLGLKYYITKGTKGK